MPDKTKGPSLKKVARTYRKAHTTPKVNEVGSHFWDHQNTPSSRGSSSSRLTYKPKAMGATYGVSTPKGGSTRRVNRAKSK